MDDLLREFLTETFESLDVVDVELVKFEQDPNNEAILSNIFRLVHTIKGTCGFLGLPRLEALAHAAETLMGKYRDGAEVTGDGVTIILHTLDRIKEILGELEANETEPAGDDTDLISQLEAFSIAAEAGGEPPAEAAAEEEAPIEVKELERELKPGEVSLDDLERAFQEAEGPDDMEAAAPAAETEEVVAEAVEAEPVEAAAPAPKPAAKPAAKPVAAKAAPKAEEATARESSVANQSIRVNVDTLENLMTMVSELVLSRNQLLEMVRRLDDSEFKVPLQRLSNVTAELQEAVMKTRMQPIGNAWQKLPRIIRDLSNELGKKIDLVMEGAETELDRQVLDLIKDPLTHMVRNSADHGLEMPDARVAAGKSETGKVTLRAFHEGGHIIIQIEDDGHGLNTDRIREKVIENGIATAAELEEKTEAQIHKYIFAAGFSTAAAVTNVSGRGVGMDVVRTNIELIGGNVDLVSVSGKGTTFTIKIPLTLAIVSSLIVESGAQRFAIPQLAVVELVRAKAESEARIEKINDTPVLRLRSKLLPLVYLDELLLLNKHRKPDEDGNMPLPTAERSESFVIVAQVGPAQFGIVVDTVFDTEEIVVKPSASMLRDINMFSGNTILGDGSVIMIIDPNGIAQCVSREVAAQLEDGPELDAHLLDNENTSLLIFRAGGGEPKAVPLSLVTRLEEVVVDEIEMSDHKPVVQYRGKLMPLQKVSADQEMVAEGRQPILVFTDDGRSMGLVVDEIVDVIEAPLDMDITSETPGMLGSAIVRDKATEIIDVGHFLTLAFEDWFARADGQRTDEATSKRVLLVDDSPFFRNMLAPLLNAAGYRVTTAADPHDAFQLRDAGARFDIIVSDIEMPGMDGFDFAEAVKNDAAWGTTPIVAMSSRTSREDIQRGHAVGFSDYVAKTDRDGLIDVLRETLQNEGAVA
ncbi:Signal transduction histidine kinase CheA [Candidatus Phaeomarinobacter ectocarpi]|uniref:Chemotaxis protein CheA n=1 Tax=Candidatus Phaeomarinibacter ectocarpi TaxID=1458461 RepID=X5MM13_9HYPH|nr:chemotaxis protein CheW [Candidatus Phaeomarinobacter ectocarpi]CDO58861.1 Signal transduction histidine kinase CheA [Candidatus Phaeomarinobacter ectocarpi]